MQCCPYLKCSRTNAQFSVHPTAIMKDPNPIILFVYSLCNGIGSPLLAIQWAVESFNFTKSVEEQPLEIHSTFIFETSPAANKASTAILHYTKYPGTVEYLGNLSGFHQHAVQLPLAIPEGKPYRILVVSGTPCKSISYACTKSPNRTRFGIHADPSNIFWMAQAGLNRLYEDHDHWMWSFAENVIPGSSVDLHELDANLGYRYRMDVPLALGAPRKRYFWTSYRAEPPPVPVPATDSQGRYRLPSGWNYPDKSLGLPCVRAIFPYLFWNFAQSPEEMTPADRMVVMSCQLLNSEDNSLRLPSMSIWAEVMGLNSHLLQVLQSVFPCAGTVSASYPQFHKAKCGRWAYCDQCSEILTMLGEGWHLTVVSHFLYHSFVSYIRACDTDYHLFFSFMQPVHQCSRSCPLARTRL